MKILAPLIALLLASCATPPPELAPDLRVKIDDGVGTKVVLPKNSGLVIGLLKDGVPTVLGYGRVSERVDAAPGADTVFEIGSITKTFTGLLLWQAVREGRMTLDDPIVKHLPKKVDAPDFNGKEITLLHLATHTSGLPPAPGNLAPKLLSNPWADYGVDQLYLGLESAELATEPGTHYTYSNFGAGLLGQILASRAGQSYESLVVERICRPLGLRDTTVTLSDDQKRRLAPGHLPDGSETPNWEFQSIAGAGALRSTASDMLRYVEAAFDDANAGMLIPRTEPVGGTRVGIAWHLTPIPSKGPTIVWHTGGTGGYRSFAGFVKEPRIAVVALTNSSASLDLLGVTLLRLLLDVQ
jgi:D-alanyl-D-alanine-carboxypeptidase/D-alanyl-D-alanine-endopeptidase